MAFISQRKKARAHEEQRNIAAGNPGDVDFIGLVREWRRTNAKRAQPHGSPRVGIAIRKRPLSDKERAVLDHDAITCLHPVVWVHSAKRRVDGITKYLEHAKFVLDHAFDETCATEQVYIQTTLPLVQLCLQGIGGRATVFAFGQTGSGKTYTMQGIQQFVAHDFFPMLEQANLGDDVDVFISSFELYSGSVLDLLNDRKKLKLQEDGKGEVVVSGLSEVPAMSGDELLSLLEAGNEMRTTHSTESNDTSSRSHAILQIKVRRRSNRKLLGKLSLVDLAGSERWSDTRQHDSQRRGESADINTSLLALKECMRALNTKAAHIPYRQSKLTLMLKDCFASAKAMTSMIATVSPGANSADHTINTLRYAEHTRAGGTKNSMPVLTRKLQRPGATSKTSNETQTKRKASVSPLRQAPKEQQHVTRQARDIQSNAKKQQAIIDMHMEHLHATAELLGREKELIAVKNNDQRNNHASLEDILNRKEAMIRRMQQAIDAYVKTCDDDACFDSYEV